MIIEDLTIQGPFGENKDYKFSCKVKMINQIEFNFQDESILDIWKNLPENQQILMLNTFILKIVEAKLGQ